MRFFSHGLRAMTAALATWMAASEAQAGALAIACGESIDAEITVLGDRTVFTFDALPGEQIAIATTSRSPSALFEPCWSLFDGGNRQLGSAVCAHTAERTLQGPGPYRIEVFDKYDDGAGGYTVRLEPRSGLFNEKASCATPLACGADELGTLASHVATDTYRFDANAGEVVAVATIDKSQSSLFEPCWQLLSMTGEPVGSAVCEANGERVLPATGSYTIIVFDKFADGYGAYRLRLEPVGGYFAGRPTCAKDFRCEGSESGELTSPRARDTFRFRAEAGRPVTIGIRKQEPPPAANFQPCWQLRGPSGNAVGSVVCNGRQQRIPGVSGIHTVRVLDKFEDGSGRYEISIGGQCSPVGDGDDQPDAASAR